MTTFIISYDLGASGSPEAVESIIKSSGDAMQILSQVWAVNTEREAKPIRDDIRAVVGEGGRAFVLKSGRTAAWANIVGQNKWLMDNL